MSDVGKLCHKSGGSSLAYKHGGNALIFKAARPGGCTVQVDCRPATWICQTYNVEHQNTFSCNGAFAVGGGNVARTASGTSVVFTLTNITGPATFSVTFSNASNCSTTEDPGVKVNVVAAQSGAVPRMKTNVRCPMVSEGVGSITVTFDASGKLTGVQ